QIIDQRQGKKVRVEGTYQTLLPGEELALTIQMPDFSEQQDDISVYFEERSPGITQMTFNYKSDIPKERRLTQLEYKQKKKAYHDNTVHGFENMFDTMQKFVEEQTEINQN
ncbi:SRPBCC domain-containing protein, partial [Staphylococcus hyicus]